MDQKRNREDESVIAQYNVIGIQEYIFRSNRLKEIVGASNKVKDIFQTTFQTIIQSMLNSNKIKEMEGTDISQYILDWRERKEYSFEHNSSIQMEVLYANAGNATILFRNRKLCIEINKVFTKYIMEHISGLRLCIGIAKKTNSFKADNRELEENFQAMKISMPSTNMGGRLPILKYEISTGLPLSNYKKNNGDFISVETNSKLNNYKEQSVVEVDNLEEEKYKLLDELVLEKGESSLLAIVHIDGNNMGNQIRKVKNQEGDYEKAVPQMRQMSNNINQVFNVKAYNKMISALEHWIEKQDKKVSYRRYLRKIVNAGDDITFICTAKLALSLSEIYFEEVSNYSLMDDDTKFSACAGVAIINSHFPFFEGCKVAEECCKQAKKRAKEQTTEENKIGNWIDFQICRNMYLSNDFEKVRDKQYHILDNTYLLKRPYMVATTNYPISKGVDSYSYTQFKDYYKQFVKEEKVSNHWLIELRNAYCEGEREAFLTQNKIRACGFKTIEKLYTDVEGKKTANYFDVLEMLELYEELEREE